MLPPCARYVQRTCDAQHKWPTVRLCHHVIQITTRSWADTDLDGILKRFDINLKESVRRASPPAPRPGYPSPTYLRSSSNSFGRFPHAYPAHHVHYLARSPRVGRRTKLLLKTERRGVSEGDGSWTPGVADGSSRRGQGGPTRRVQTRTSCTPSPSAGPAWVAAGPLVPAPHR